MVGSVTSMKTAASHMHASAYSEPLHSSSKAAQSASIDSSVVGLRIGHSAVDCQQWDRPMHAVTVGESIGALRSLTKAVEIHRIAPHMRWSLPHTSSRRSSPTRPMRHGDCRVPVHALNFTTSDLRVSAVPTEWKGAPAATES